MKPKTDEEEWLIFWPELVGPLRELVYGSKTTGSKSIELGQMREGQAEISRTRLPCQSDFKILSFLVESRFFYFSSGQCAPRAIQYLR